MGQLAWIADKVTEGTDPASGIDDDRLLTTVMLYWLTGTAGSSSRLHRENAARGGPPAPCRVPLGVAVFARDLVRPLHHRHVAGVEFGVLRARDAGEQLTVVLDGTVWSRVQPMTSVGASILGSRARMSRRWTRSGRSAAAAAATGAPSEKPTTSGSGTRSPCAAPAA
ncbi:hypothetical protein [Spirillospora sp. NPDC077959]|uniref:hypothetical protein n=1 Tax=Spirillospora sp. NPDC077959 TaxID=3364529 RepID=UPI0037D240AE